MKLVGWMAASSALSSIAAAALTENRREVWLGMIGPLAAASGTWWMIQRIFRRDPSRITPAMMKAFALKAVFFGAYVAAAVKIVGVQPVPFAISFTSYFLALHVVEAIGLRRLLAGRS